MNFRYGRSWPLRRVDKKKEEKQVNYSVAVDVTEIRRKSVKMEREG